MIHDQSQELIVLPSLARSERGALLSATVTLWRKHMTRFFRSREEFGGTFLQPLLWVLLFGVGMGHLLRDEPGVVAATGANYMAFIMPGIIVLSALGGAAGGGMTLVEERLKGALREYLVAPIPRLSILLSSELSTTTKALLQALLILVLGAFAGAMPSTRPLAWVGALLLVAGFAIGFASLALAFAAHSRSIMGYHGIIALFNLPLLFASNALYPLEVLPDWLRLVVLCNPATYVVDALRGLLYGAPAALPLELAFLVIGAFAVASSWLALVSFRRAVRRVTSEL